MESQSGVDAGKKKIRGIDLSIIDTEYFPRNWILSSRHPLVWKQLMRPHFRVLPRLTRRSGRMMDVYIFIPLDLGRRVSLH